MKSQAWVCHAERAPNPVQRADGPRAAGRASTHEALGVAIEEWDELRDAIRSNDLKMVAYECLDLAAVLIRLARQLRACDYKHNRSVK